MSPMIGESVTIHGENSQRILLISSHKQWSSPISATYENQALQLLCLGLQWDHCVVRLFACCSIRLFAVVCKYFCLYTLKQSMSKEMNSDDDSAV